jgi:hypothetical protein
MVLDDGSEKEKLDKVWFWVSAIIVGAVFILVVSLAIVYIFIL